MSTREAWVADMERLRPVLEPHVFQTSDGMKYLDPGCPVWAANLHAKLTQIGYTNGYFTA